MTELEALKKKCINKDGSTKKGATQKDLERLKFLRDAEPLSKDDLAEAKKREEERAVKDKAEYDARIASKAGTPKIDHDVYEARQDRKGRDEPSLDAPGEHPRIVKLKEALRPFTEIECHDSRQNEYVLFRRGVAITAGDIRMARKAMKL